MSGMGSTTASQSLQSSLDTHPSHFTRAILGSRAHLDLSLIGSATAKELDSSFLSFGSCVFHAPDEHIGMVGSTDAWLGAR